MSRVLGIFAAVAAAGLLAVAAVAGSSPSLLAQLGPGGARVKDAGGTVVLSVPLSRPVPWRVATGDAPPRVVVEFGDVVWKGAPKITSESVAAARAEKVRPGWTEVSLILREPLEVESAEMATRADGSAVLEVRMLPTTADAFRRLAVAPGSDAGAKAIPGGRTVVALDPGHGGRDPGAMAGGLVEADLMLAVARRLKEVLDGTGRFEVVLTREEDVFVPLETRLTRARAAGADVFLSLHADALEDGDGEASGLTVYRLDEDATDEADAILAARHGGGDILKGLDLTEAGDDVALALLDLARRDTLPRTESLQRTLVEAFRGAGLHVNSRPERAGAFAVLKSAEIPSVLIELGFLSSTRDRERLTAESWQTEAATAVADGLLRWQEEDKIRFGALTR